MKDRLTDRVRRAIRRHVEFTGEQAVEFPMDRDFQTFQKDYPKAVNIAPMLQPRTRECEKVFG